MLHFPSTFASGPSSPHITSLNATQTALPKESGNEEDVKLFSAIEEELHDTRRVARNGQEDDLRMALEMMIGRVTSLTSLLKTAYKNSSELSIQLSVAQSNLQIYLANNEMLEEELKRARDTRGRPDVGWRRSVPPNAKSSPYKIEEKEEDSAPSTPTSTTASAPGSANGSPTIPANPPPPDQSQTAATNNAPAGGSRFLSKFRFSTPSLTRPTTSRPSTPPPPHPVNGHLSSASMPSLPLDPGPSSSTSSLASTPEEDRLSALQSELAQLQNTHQSLIHQTQQLSKAKEECEKEKDEAMKAKVLLEGEIESLSQALFEEANKMVASERIKHHEAQLALKDEISVVKDQVEELREEKEALKSALKVVERENQLLRKGRTPQTELEAAGDEQETAGPTESRSSSRMGVKSPPRSRAASRASSLPPLPLSPILRAPDITHHYATDDEGHSYTDDEGDDQDSPAGLKTARPPLSPFRHSRAFGPPETLPISSLEVLKMLKMQGEEEKQEEEQHRKEDEVQKLPETTSSVESVSSKEYVTPQSTPASSAGVPSVQAPPAPTAKGSEHEEDEPPFIKSPSPVPSAHPWEGEGNPWASPTYK